MFHMFQMFAAAWIFQVRQEDRRLPVILLRVNKGLKDSLLVVFYFNKKKKKKKKKL